MLLTASAMMTSCGQKDNLLIPDGNDDPEHPQKTIVVLDGKEYETELVATFTGEIGAEVTLTLGVYDPYDIYGVDFGDGVIVADTVCFENGGLKDDEGYTREGTQHKSATKFTGTVAGDGTVKVYGNSDLWYVVGGGGVVPTSFDQPKLAKVVQMSFTGANVESVVLPKMEFLTQFSFNNSAARSIDVSKATALTSLTINSTTASKFEPQLESIDLSQNTELTYLSIQGNQNHRGKLTSLDLSSNSKLSGMGLYVQYNEIMDLKLAENTLTAINVQDNYLSSLDLSKLPKLKSLYASNNTFLGEFDLTSYETLENVQLSNNLLSSIKVNNVTKQFYVDRNELTLATIPAQPAGMNSKNKTKQFHYAPQCAMTVPETVTELDLSSQLTVAQGELSPADYATPLSGTTTYSFVTSSGTNLVEGTDYVVTAPGKFKFIKPQAEKVTAIMLNEALPKLTGDDAFVTTEFTVKAAATAAMTWDFTTWSAATVTNLIADAAASKTEGWSDVEKAADAAADAEPTEAAKDNCFWFAGTVNADGSLSANGKVIEELKGLKFDPDYAAKRSLAIAVKYPSTSLGDYDGGAYLWLGGGGSKQTCPCFTIPGVKAGQKLTISMESHKLNPADARGIQIYANSYDAANQIGEAFKPTVKASNTWTIDKDCDVVVWNTSGCHIYSITIE